MTGTTETPSIASILKKIQKDHGLRVGSLSSVAEDIEPITTGNISIDEIVGIGGLPLGRSVELYGPPSSGKTTTALMAAANLQRDIIASGREQYILYNDFEHALDKEYCAALGLNLEHESFLFSQPDTLEQGSNASLDLISTGLVKMTIWDSVAAMTPQDMLSAEVGKVTVALQARLMGDLLRKLNPLLDEHKCCAVFLNHLHEVIEMGGYKAPGPPRTTTPGGRALKHYASVRVEYQQIKNITSVVEDDLTHQEIKRVEATNVRVRVVKNKVAPPFREAIVRVRFGRGFDNFWSALQILTGRGNIKLATGYYYFDKLPELVHEDMGKTNTGRPFIRGEEVILAFADTHPEWRQSVIDCAVDIVRGKVSEKVLLPAAAEKEPLQTELIEDKPIATLPVVEKDSTAGKIGIVGVDDLLFRGEAAK